MGKTTTPFLFCIRREVLAFLAQKASTTVYGSDGGGHKPEVASARLPAPPWPPAHASRHERAAALLSAAVKTSARLLLQEHPPCTEWCVRLSVYESLDVQQASKSNATASPPAP